MPKKARTDTWRKKRRQEYLEMKKYRKAEENHLQFIEEN